MQNHEWHFMGFDYHNIMEHMGLSTVAISKLTNSFFTEIIRQCQVSIKIPLNFESKVFLVLKTRLR